MKEDENNKQDVDVTKDLDVEIISQESAESVQSELSENTSQDTSKPAKKKVKKDKKFTEEDEEEEDAVNQSLQDEIELLKKSFEETQSLQKESEDKALRAYAELENFKRRKEQEKADFVKFSTEKTILNLLPIIDGFELAMNQLDTDQDNLENVKEGFILIYKQLNDFLEKQHVKKLDALNKTFDPNLHQAVSQEDSESAESNTVIKVFQAGYKLNERVIRPAMVVVAN